MLCIKNEKGVVSGQELMEALPVEFVTLFMILKSKVYSY